MTENGHSEQLPEPSFAKVMFVRILVFNIGSVIGAFLYYALTLNVKITSGDMFAFGAFISCLLAGYAVAFCGLMAYNKAKWGEFRLIDNEQNRATASIGSALLFGIFCFGTPLAIMTGTQRALDTSEGSVLFAFAGAFGQWIISGILFGLLMRAVSRNTRPYSKAGSS